MKPRTNRSGMAPVRAVVIDPSRSSAVSIADHFRAELIATALGDVAASTHIEPEAVFRADRCSQYNFGSVSAPCGGVWG